MPRISVTEVRSVANAKVLEEKKAQVAALSEKLKGANSGVLIDYKGITVAEDTALRSEMRKNDVHYAVVKNTMLRLVFDECGLGELDPLLNGTTSIAVSEDSIAPARIADKFSEKLGDGKFTVKGGFVEGRVMSAAELKAIAAIPSKDALVAQVLGTMLAPISSLAFVIKQIADKGGAPVEAAAEEAPAVETPAEETAPAAEAPAEEAAPEAAPAE